MPVSRLPIEISSRILPIFEGKNFPVLSTPTEGGLLGHLPNPRQGFDPFSTANGTKVIFINHPSQLGPFSDLVAPRWKNSVGWTLAVNEEMGLFGIRADHTLVQCPLFKDKKKVWRDVGGAMLRRFSYPLMRGIADVGDKSPAMSVKQIAVQQRQIMAGLLGRVSAGGGKTVIWGPDEADLMEAAVSEFGIVMEICGSSFSAVDEGLSPRFLNAFARTARTTFIGAPPEVGLIPLLTSNQVASPTTAKGIIAGLRWFFKNIEPGKPKPTTLLGAGGVGAFVAEELISRNNLFGLIEANAETATKIKAKSPETKVVLDVQSTNNLFGAMAAVNHIQKAREASIPIAFGTADALTMIGSGALVFSPNGQAHVYEGEVAETIVSLGYLTGIGAANSPYPPDLKTGDPYVVADFLQSKGFFGPGAEHLNLGGLTKVEQGFLGLTDEEIDHQLMPLCGIGLKEEYEHAYQAGEAPQRWRDRQAHEDWKRDFLDKGIGIGWES